MRAVCFAILSSSLVLASTDDKPVEQVHPFGQADEELEYPPVTVPTDEIAHPVGDDEECVSGLVAAIKNVREGGRLTRNQCISAFSSLMMRSDVFLGPSGEDIIDQLREQLELADRSSTVNHFLAHNIPEIRSIIKAMSSGIVGDHPSAETISQYLPLMTDLITSYSVGKRTQ